MYAVATTLAPVDRLISCIFQKLKEKPGAQTEGEKKTTNLYSRLERQEGVPRVAHLEYSSKPILGQVADLENLQVRRHGAEVELGDDNVIDDDRRLRRLVEGRRQEIAGA